MCAFSHDGLAERSDGSVEHGAAVGRCLVRDGRRKVACSPDLCVAVSGGFHRAASLQEVNTGSDGNHARRGETASPITARPRQRRSFVDISLVCRTQFLPSTCSGLFCFSSCTACHEPSIARCLKFRRELERHHVRIHAPVIIRP